MALIAFEQEFLFSVIDQAHAAALKSKLGEFGL
jgi:hypothetical protein